MAIAKQNARKVQVAASVSSEVAQQLSDKAASMGLAKAKYAGVVLTNWVKSGAKLTLKG